jgi:MerR family transcriptional regulator, redox-sensitive transcriptional activator SoxR
MSNSGHLTIGEVAGTAGLRPSAVRYYEEAGLLRPTARVRGRRVYDDDVFESLALIALAQDAGFTIAEIKVLLGGFDKATPASQRWRSLARRKLDETKIRIERAERMRDLLERLMRCQCSTLGECVRWRRAAMSAARPGKSDRSDRLASTRRRNDAVHP